MAEWLVQIVETLGYAGVALLTLVENVFPPIPSEVVLPAAGFSAKQGKLTVWGVSLAGFLGAMAGVVAWYAVGRAIGRARVQGWIDRRGRWMGLRVDDVDRAEAWFARYGRRAVFFGRVVPGVRSMISLPAGFVKMHWLPFLLYSALGTAIWTAVLVGLGWWLGSHYQLVNEYLSPISTIVVVGLVAWAVYRLVRRARRSPERTT